VLAGTRPWDSGKRPVAWSGEARGGSLRDLGFQQESGQRAEGCDVKEEEGEGRRGCFGLFIFATSVPIFFLRKSVPIFSFRMSTHLFLTFCLVPLHLARVKICSRSIQPKCECFG
jgi:hypothetical protein